MQTVTEFLYVAAGASLSSFLSYVAYKKLRPRYPITVNCWFCNKDTVVPYGNQNCWDCPFCEQYNGFEEDGEYNKPIPAQQIEEFNHPVPASNQTSENAHLFKDSSSLCHRCNQNQRYKIKQLSTFKPHCEENYDEEVEAFSQHLDRIYSLCGKCEINLNSKLVEESKYVQTSVVDHRLNESFDQDTVISRCLYFSKLQNNTSLLLRMFAILLSVLLFICDLQILQEDSGKVILPFHAVLPSVIMNTISIFGHQTSSILSVFGIFCIVLAVFSSGKYRLQKSDGFTCFAWVIVLMIHNQFISNFLSKEDFLLLRPLISMLVIICTIVSTACRRYTLSRSLKQRIPQQFSPKPSLSKKLRSLHNSFSGDMWDDATSFASQSCLNCSSRFSEVCHPMLLKKPVENPFSKNSGEFSKLPNDFFGLKIGQNAPSSTQNGLFTKKVYCDSSMVSHSKRNRKRISNGHLGSQFSSTIRPSQLNFMNNENEQSKPLSRSSWVAGGFWDSNSVTGQVQSSIGTNSNSTCSSYAGTEDKFSMFSEPSIALINSCKGVKNKQHFNAEKTSDYGSDSQLSHAGQWR